MKTQAIEWNERLAIQKSGAIHPGKRLSSATRLLSRSILAAAPALALIVGTAWLVGQPDLVVYLQAAVWTSGFVFFGLALDSEKSTIALSIATGFALPALALLSSKFTAELLIVAATIIAAWIATAVLRRQ